MTHRLYHDSDTPSFDAIVVAHDGDGTRVVLDRTAFYPTSGGQQHDTGTLGSARVIDVIDADDRIIHVVDSALPLGPVHGEVDAARRRDHTVQHTAQHLISAIAADRLGWSTESVHFGETHSTIEFDTASASEEQLRQLEEWSNDAIGAALPVTTGLEDAATATALRKPTDRTGMIRVVTIAGLDRSACGGTHVTSTARIGSVSISSSERIRGRVRVGFLAGGRVLARLHHCDALLTQLAAECRTGIGELAELIPARMEALRQAEKRIDELEQGMAIFRLQQLIDAAGVGRDDSRRIVLDRWGESAGVLHAMAQAVQHQSRLCLVATTEAPPTIILAASPDSGMDCGAALKSAVTTVGGRGGGSALLARGSVPAVSCLGPVLDALLELIG